MIDNMTSVELNIFKTLQSDGQHNIYWTQPAVLHFV